MLYNQFYPFGNKKEMRNEYCRASFYCSVQCSSGGVCVFPYRGVFLWLCVWKNFDRKDSKEVKMRSFDVTGPNPNDWLESMVWGCILFGPFLLLFGGVGALIGWLVSHQLIWMWIGAVAGVVVLIVVTQLMSGFSLRSWKNRS
ncbi:MAG: hypothetical protein ABIB98_03595 [bacterium]